MSIEFGNRLTLGQEEKIKKIGILNLYDLITNFPYRIDSLEPYDPSKYLSNKQYLVDGFIQSYETIYRGRKFIKLNIGGKYNFMAYIFNTSPYITSMINKKDEFQFIIENKNNFWTIKKFIEKKPLVEDKFVLGKAKMKKYFVPTYQRNLNVIDSTFKAIHTRLHRNDYLLNLHGLVPTNQHIPEIIDLYNIHHPPSVQAYYDTIRQFTSLKVFLRIILIKYMDQNASQKKGLSTKLDKKYLKKITDCLPYTLSLSQKTTIWDILNDLSNKGE